MVARMIPNTVETAAELKARGAFYTPAALTRFMTTWAIRTPADTILEPSCGDGAFVEAVVARLHELGGDEGGLVGVEREPSEAQKARRLAPAADIRAVDFFDLDPGDVPAQDVVVGNPPYIRYQSFIGADREKALARTRGQGVELSGLASSWAHFVIHAAGFLKSAGRLALVVPAELLHTDYAEPVRRFLLQRFSSVTVIAFDYMVFGDAQVDAVILLAANDVESGLRVIRVKRDSDLEGLTIPTYAAADIVGTGRWSGAIDPSASGVYDRAVSSTATRRLGDWARVDIGFVTGANAYFVLSPDDAKAAGLPANVLTPVVSRPREVRGLEVADIEQQLLLDLAGVTDLDPATVRYLQTGVQRGINQRYKARMRKPWYAVPLPRQRPDALIPYMAHFGPRLIVNRPGTRNSNLLHGVSLLPGAPPVRALAVAICGSMTLLSAEIEGRAYGGGVLKLETREAERLRIPDFGVAAAARLERQFGIADALIRKGEIRSAAKIADDVLGVDHGSVWAAYMVFRGRRLGRRRDRSREQARTLARR